VKTFQPGEVISYLDMCQAEGVNLQRGMNYRLRGGLSVLLMNCRPEAPYADRVEENGRVLIYEGHDVPKTREHPDPKQVDQPLTYPGGALTQNGLFYKAAQEAKQGLREGELVRVYEKIKTGLWVYNGLFRLTDAWREDTGVRKVIKFRLEIVEEPSSWEEKEPRDMDHTRIIPSWVKLAVWRRDKGKCVRCGSRDNLHFDHIIPYAKGGSSLVPENIQLLCARHNLQKRDRIQ